MLRRCGFTLFEVAVLVALLAIGAAVILPTLVSTDARARALMVNEEGVMLYNAMASFRAGVGEMPRFVSELSQPIVAGGPRGCGGVWGGGDVSDWNADNSDYGPYARHRIIPRGRGYAVRDGFGFLTDTIFREPPPTGGTTVLIIRGANITDARELDIVADGSADGATGIVRYGTAVDGSVDVRFFLPGLPC